MSNIILAICCLVMGLCAGIKFSEKYTEKFKFYKSICFFNEKLFDEIVFFKNGILSLENNDYLSARFEKILNEYSKGKNIVETLPNYLSASQKKDIIVYFNTIGKTDVATQKKLCDGYKNRFERELQTAEGEQLKYTSLCKKSGVIIGLVLFIILF